MRLQLARRTELALRALRLLEDRTEMVRANELGRELATTPEYLPQVLRPLVRAGWLESQPGPTGGYRIVAKLGSRSLLELIELSEGPTDANICVLRGAECDPTEPCAMHGAWLTAREALVERLAELPISKRTKELRG